MCVADSISKVMLIYYAGGVLFLFTVRSDGGFLYALETSLAFVAISTSVWARADALITSI